MIPNFDEITFKEKLRTLLTPAQPIDSIEQLHGRDKKLRSIDRALSSPGKHIFIYGDRGVGKSSLARTVSALHQPSNLDDIMISCDNDSDFYSLVQDIARRFCKDSYFTSNRELEVKGGLQFPIINGSLSEKIKNGIIPDINTINDAGYLLKEVCPLHEDADSVVVIDEFDQVPTNKDKKLFADLIKFISDNRIPIRFVFCGIGSSLNELIGVHLSTDRYLSPIKLEPIPHDSRWKIITNAADALGVEVDRETYIRIGHISDGFPYYVHLIGENLFWAMFDDEDLVDKCALKHFHKGVNGAVEESSTSLRNAYEVATHKNSADRQYEYALWAVADGTEFKRATSEVYENSYIPIMKELNLTALEKKTFQQKLARLKSDSHGGILESPLRSWYQYKENIIRGYVRMRAEKEGLRIGPDHYFS